MNEGSIFPTSSPAFVVGCLVDLDHSDEEDEISVVLICISQFPWLNVGLFPLVSGSYSETSYL